MKKKILAITPYFCKSGSEIALMNLLDSIKYKLDVSIFTKNTNPELEKVLSKDIKLIYPKNQKKSKYIFFKIFKKFKSYFKIFDNSINIKRLLYENNYDYIILNTLVSLSYYNDLRGQNKNIILYVHETEQMLFLLNKFQLKYMIKEVDLILCSSNYVKNYIMMLGRKEKIEVLYPSLDFTKFNLEIRSKNIKDELGFNAADFLWAMSGDITINKNPIMFIEIANELIKKRKDINFLWIGASENNAYEIYLKERVNDLGISDKVKFMNKQDKNYYEFINAIDGLLMTSFSESYSLVAKESVCFNKPVVSFPCGGIMESVPERHLFVSKEFSIDEIVKLMILRMNSKKVNIQIEDFDTLFSNEKSVISKRFEELLNI